MLNPFRLRNPDSVAAPWRRQSLRVFRALIILQIITLIVLWYLIAQARRDPTTAEFLPTPPGNITQIPFDELAFVQGRVVQLTPEFAAYRRSLKTQIQWNNAISVTLTALIGVNVAALLIRIRRARRWRRSGLCASCGYDLHGISELNPCPECGCSQTAAIT